MNERQAVLSVAERYKKQYYTKGKWYSCHYFHSELIYSQIKKVTLLDAVDLLIENKSWTNRIRGWRNKNRKRIKP